MQRIAPRWLSAGLATLLAAAAFCQLGGAGAALATEVLLKDGRVLRGKLGKTSSMVESSVAAPADSDKLQTILFIDDNLRRIFFSERLVSPTALLPRETGNSRRSSISDSR